MADRLFRVAGDTHPNDLAGAIAKTLRAGEDCELVACGAAAVNQAVKALIVARRYLAEDGITPAWDPRFVDRTFDDGQERTAVAFDVCGRAAYPREEAAA